MMETLLIQPPRTMPKEGRSPEAVLGEWAARATEQSGGILQGEVRSRVTDFDTKAFYFDIRVPELGGSRRGIVSVHLPLDAPYPAVADAALFREAGIVRYGEMLKPLPEKQANWADDADELSAIVASVIQSPAVAEVLERLVALVLEQRKAK